VLALEPGFGLDVEAQREHLRSAATFRASLAPRDLALLQIAEVRVASDAPDHAHVVARARDAATHFPDDAEMAYVLGRMLCEAGDTRAGFAELDRAVALDPGFAMPLWARSTYENEAGAPDDALRSVERCLSASPSAASCLRVRAKILNARGECAKAEQDARSMIAIEPRGHHAYEYLAMSLAANGAPLASVKDALRKRESLVASETSKRRITLEDDANLALLAGDFGAAEKSLREIAKSRDTESSESAHESAAMLILLYEETGASKAALAVADDYASRLAAWTPDAPGHARPLVLATRRRAGQLTEAEFRKTRDAWIGEARARSASKFTWLDFYARPARTADEARAALAALGNVEAPYAGDVVYEQAAGHVDLLAGRVDAAIPRLRAAAAACDALASPIESTRASADLGRALEKKGDTAGACAAYATVLARWGHAKPRSLTRESTEARARALRCALPRR
jgi:hypothetical protein